MSTFNVTANLFAQQLATTASILNIVNDIDGTTASNVTIGSISGTVTINGTDINMGDTSSNVVVNGGSITIGDTSSNVIINGNALSTLTFGKFNLISHITSSGAVDLVVQPASLYFVVQNNGDSGIRVTYDSSGNTITVPAGDEAIFTMSPNGFSTYGVDNTAQYAPMLQYHP